MPKKNSSHAILAVHELGTDHALPSAESSVERVDTRYLEGLIGYNARRAALAVIEVFLTRMAPYGLRPVDFSILSLIMLNRFEARGLVERRPHPSDRRAQGLHLTPAGQALMKEAEHTAEQLEKDVAHKLTAQEHLTLMELLQKIYL